MTIHKGSKRTFREFLDNIIMRGLAIHHRPWTLESLERVQLIPVCLHAQGIPSRGYNHCKSTYCVQCHANISKVLLHIEALVSVSAVQ